jgi:2,3,4,5-tetrahydropyridine-2-carboxylate N-succinyltransferase
MNTPYSNDTLNSTLTLNLTELQSLIEISFENRASINHDNIQPELQQAINSIFVLLDQGKLRVAEKTNKGWHVNQWLKKAILLSFKANKNNIIESNYIQFYDKVPLKYHNLTSDQFEKNGVRVVPNAVARYGSYIGSNTVLMPSYVNIGAYIDSGCMIDTWATVGSCAQIGKNVHLSGGAGIGGVLEPLQANPTIIEDDCFIGARSEIVEGVIIGEGSVISMGVFLGQSTKIYNRLTGEISHGYIPPYSVVVPGSLPAKDGSHSLACAVIIKQVDAKTRSKVGINELLRGSDE